MLPKNVRIFRGIIFELLFRNSKANVVINTTNEKDFI